MGKYSQRSRQAEMTEKKERREGKLGAPMRGLRPWKSTINR